MASTRPFRHLTDLELSDELARVGAETLLAVGQAETAAAHLLFSRLLLEQQRRAAAADRSRRPRRSWSV